MFCSNCGTQVNDDARFCPKCGRDLGAGEVATPTPTPAYDPVSAPHPIPGPATLYERKLAQATSEGL
ncbi:MAG: zinc ribbon domain-containing protein, partial [Coriobacteriales bacterium]|nr:zinc ribbon domain-containing protein [Coriobacteriales bacterium]